MEIINRRNEFTEYERNFLHKVFVLFLEKYDSDNFVGMDILKHKLSKIILKNDSDKQNIVISVQGDSKIDFKDQPGYIPASYLKELCDEFISPDLFPSFASFFIKNLQSLNKSLTQSKEIPSLLENALNVFSHHKKQEELMIIVKDFTKNNVYSMSTENKEIIHRLHHSPSLFNKNFSFDELLDLHILNSHTDKFNIREAFALYPEKNDANPLKPLHPDYIDFYLKKAIYFTPDEKLYRKFFEEVNVDPEFQTIIQDSSGNTDTESINSYFKMKILLKISQLAEIHFVKENKSRPIDDTTPLVFNTLIDTHLSSLKIPRNNQFYRVIDEIANVHSRIKDNYEKNQIVKATAAQKMSSDHSSPRM